MWQLLYSCYLAWQLSLPDYVIMRILKSISPGFKLQYSLVAKPISVKRADRQTEVIKGRDTRRPGYKRWMDINNQTERSVIYLRFTNYV